MRLLLGLTERCQGHEAKDAQFLLERLATLHLAKATRDCRVKDFAEALPEFQEISTLAYPEKFLLAAKDEAVWCRLDSARAMEADDWLLEEALEQ